MMMVHSMSVTVEMELKPVELETLSLVLVSVPITHIGIGNTSGPLDIDECLRNATICGLGTCTNNDGGSFYECDCRDGAETSGTGNTLTCVGRSTNHTHFF